MDKVAQLPAEDRAALFGETGAARGVADTIIEKDFWVCWTLKRLFGLQEEDAAALVFKGGTFLSKAFGAIRRFSEDIDLSFDRADLGYAGDRDPEAEGISRKKSAQHNSRAYPPCLASDQEIISDRHAAPGDSAS